MKMRCPNCDALRHGEGTLWKVKQYKKYVVFPTRNMYWWCSCCGYTEDLDAKDHKI